MKNKTFLAACIMMTLPLSVSAQENIKHAFDALVGDSHAAISTIHKLNKDPETGVKEGQLDVYEFTLPISKLSLVKNIERAFDKDKDQAYTLNTASAPGKKQYNYESLAVGGSSSGYMLGNIRGSRYIYACFLDPADETKTYRYAYAMEWAERKDEVEGKLVITYATTQKYRQRRTTRTIFSGDGGKTSLSVALGDLESNLENRGSIDLSAFGGNDERNNTEKWLLDFNSCKNLFLKKPDGSSATVYAIHIYKLCKKADCLEAGEKSIVVTEITKLKDNTKDEFIRNMFDKSIEHLKK